MHLAWQVTLDTVEGPGAVVWQDAGPSAESESARVFDTVCLTLQFTGYEKKGGGRFYNPETESTLYPTRWGSRVS